LKDIEEKLTDLQQRESSVKLKEAEFDNLLQSNKEKFKLLDEKTQEQNSMFNAKRLDLNERERKISEITSKLQSQQNDIKERESKIESKIKDIEKRENKIKASLDLLEEERKQFRNEKKEFEQVKENNSTSESPRTESRDNLTSIELDDSKKLWVSHKITDKSSKRRSEKLTRRIDPSVDGPMHARREQIAKEVLNTEKTYVKTLKMLCDVFVTPLKQLIPQKKLILTEEQIESVFTNIDSLLQINMEFLRKLGSALDNWTWDTELGQTFLDLALELPQYTAFINNFDMAMENYTNFMKRKNFSTFISEQQKKYPEANIYLQFFFLIQPVQRIPRYILLLKDLLKYTPDLHPDKAVMEKAVEKNH